MPILDPHNWKVLLRNDHPFLKNYLFLQASVLLQAYWTPALCCLDNKQVHQVSARYKHEHPSSEVKINCFLFKTLSTGDAFKVFHPSFGLRQKMLNLIQNLSYYMMVEVSKIFILRAGSSNLGGLNSTGKHLSCVEALPARVDEFAGRAGLAPLHCY